MVDRPGRSNSVNPEFSTPPKAYVQLPVSSKMGGSAQAFHSGEQPLTVSEGLALELRDELLAELSASGLSVEELFALVEHDAAKFAEAIAGVTQPGAYGTGGSLLRSHELGFNLADGMGLESNDPLVVKLVDVLSRKEAIGFLRENSQLADGAVLSDLSGQIGDTGISELLGLAQLVFSVRGNPKVRFRIDLKRGRFNAVKQELDEIRDVVTRQREILLRQATQRQHSLRWFLDAASRFQSLLEQKADTRSEALDLVAKLRVAAAEFTEATGVAKNSLSARFEADRLQLVEEGLASYGDLLSEQVAVEAEANGLEGADGDVTEIAELESLGEASTLNLFYDTPLDKQQVGELENLAQEMNDSLSWLSASLDRKLTEGQKDRMLTEAEEASLASLAAQTDELLNHTQGKESATHGDALNEGRRTKVADLAPRLGSTIPAVENSQNSSAEQQRQNMPVSSPDGGVSGSPDPSPLDSLKELKPPEASVSGEVSGRPESAPIEFSETAALTPDPGAEISSANGLSVSKGVDRAAEVIDSVVKELEKPATQDRDRVAETVSLSDSSGQSESQRPQNVASISPLDSLNEPGEPDSTHKAALSYLAESEQPAGQRLAETLKGLEDAVGNPDTADGDVAKGILGSGNEGDGAVGTAAETVNGSLGDPGTADESLEVVQALIKDLSEFYSNFGGAKEDVAIQTGQPSQGGDDTDAARSQESQIQAAGDGSAGSAAGTGDVVKRHYEQVKEMAGAVREAAMTGIADPESSDDLVQNAWKFIAALGRFAATVAGTIAGGPNAGAAADEAGKKIQGAGNKALSMVGATDDSGPANDKTAAATKDRGGGPNREDGALSLA